MKIGMTLTIIKRTMTTDQPSYREQELSWRELRREQNQWCASGVELRRGRELVISDRLLPVYWRRRRRR
jgi:hypothetical protein